MPTFFLIYSFVIGAIVGSFLNVVALRYNTGMTLKGRSKCFSCGKNLNWRELVPVFSFLFQKGKCKNCKSKISWQYPLVEIMAGILFIMIFFVFPPTTIQESFTTLFYIFVTCLLLIITIYDIKHKIIPDSMSYTFSAVALAHLFIGSDLSFIIPNWTQLLAGPLLSLPFVLMFLISKGTWMGLGDAKLVLGIGWILGISAGISAIVLAFWIGAVISIMWMYIIFRKIKSRYEIPFGPYLILGMYIVLLFEVKIIDLRPFYEIFFK